MSWNVQYANGNIEDTLVIMCTRERINILKCGKGREKSVKCTMMEVSSQLT